MFLLCSAGRLTVTLMITSYFSCKPRTHLPQRQKANQIIYFKAVVSSDDNIIQNGFVV